MTAASTGTAPARRESSRSPRPEHLSRGYRSHRPDAVRVIENLCPFLAADLTTEDLRLLGTCLREELCPEPGRSRSGRRCRIA
ncbi:hypothetical protein [Streptomyces mexicanus]|uniref:hypothetical protein n=1 Tax=Streptomyces mexicanus TaxID=178566 RepID=UPI0036471C89